MVTGKRDFLSENAKDLIRRAGIFHVVTISGVQMSWSPGFSSSACAGCSPVRERLALNYPIKKWAAALAIFGAILYDLGTGSRVGTERALVMTLVMLVAVLFDRPALVDAQSRMGGVLRYRLRAGSVAGREFSALLRRRRRADRRVRGARRKPRRDARRAGDRARGWLADARFCAPLARRLRPDRARRSSPRFCATSATASFMANDFHELSPYVLIGNPLDAWPSSNSSPCPARCSARRCIRSGSTDSCGAILGSASTSLLISRS